MAWDTEQAWFVAWRDDPDDWVARFEKSAGREAEEWAKNMVRVYNARLARGTK